MISDQRIEDMYGLCSKHPQTVRDGWVVQLIDEYRALECAINNYGLAVYLTDDGKTILKPWNPTSGVPNG